MTPPPVLADLDSRTRAIFGEIVETYLETGEPVGSRTISRRSIGLSAASIRTVMADLADMGLLDSPHASAGRNPTHVGLRLFVDGLLQVENLSENDQNTIDKHLQTHDQSNDGLLGRTSQLLSGLSGVAGLVASPQSEDVPVKHIEFVSLSANEALLVLVTADGDVENRILTLPPGLPGSALTEAGNYLNRRIRGQTLTQAIGVVQSELQRNQSELDEAAAALVEDGVALWSGDDPGRGRSLIVRGRANLLAGTSGKDLNRVRELFDELERKQNLISVLDLARKADGVRLFIGSENPIFSMSGSCMIVAPYKNRAHKIIGALGVIGPTRINYARIIPMVLYTARALGKLVWKDLTHARQ